MASFFIKMEQSRLGHAKGIEDQWGECTSVDVGDPSALGTFHGQLTIVECLSVEHKILNIRVAGYYI